MVSQWGIFEARLAGPAGGNPFVDVQLSATFSCGGTVVRTEGFYDGDGAYVVRCMPSAPGEWTYVTQSNVPALSGARGSFVCGPAEPGGHGPAVVSNTFHFSYADGTPLHPIGTTAYAWIHQGQRMVEQTLATLAASPFTKVRMCVFPKHYDFNHNDPTLYAFERDAGGRFDFTRFSLPFFRHLESCVARLAGMGIEADIILFHPYDRWGFSDMGVTADDRYLRYIIARLSAYRNVWWSLANEFDVMPTKCLADWDRFCGILRDRDAYGHLRSIHNCFPDKRYDHAKPWITHVSLQWQEDDAAFVGRLREQYRKPVCLDECGYEGDINHGWGNLPPQELVYKAWQAVALGAHACCHGETYWNKEELLWWSKGGVLRGQSPARFGLLRRVLAEAGGPLNPSPLSSWDFPAASTADNATIIIYFGRKQPCFRPVSLPPGTYRLDIIDTWNMTVEPWPQQLSGEARLALPGRPYIAARLTRV